MTDERETGRSEADVEAFKDALELLLWCWGNRFSSDDAYTRMSEAFNKVVGMYREAIGVPHPMDTKGKDR